MHSIKMAAVVCYNRWNAADCDTPPQSTIAYTTSGNTAMILQLRRTWTVTIVGTATHKRISHVSEFNAQGLLTLFPKIHSFHIWIWVKWWLFQWFRVIVIALSESTVMCLLILWINPLKKDRFQAFRGATNWKPRTWASNFRFEHIFSFHLWT